MDVFNEKGAVLEDILAGLVGKGVVDVQPYISRHALDVICGRSLQRMSLSSWLLGFVF